MKENRWSLVNISWRFVLLLWSLTILFPLFWIFYGSLKSNKEFFQSAWALPSVPQWGNYVNAWTQLEISGAMFNSLYYVGGSMLISLTMTTFAAYSLTRLEWRGRQLVWGYFMLSLLLPGINALVPQYVIASSLNLNSLTGIVLLQGFGLSVFELMVLGGFMQTLPKELEESAHLDGASLFQILRHIILPLSYPGIITISIFKFLGLYNDFIFPYIYISEESKYPISVKIFFANQVMQYKNDFVTLFACLIITIIPSIIVYMLFQKQVMEGATVGAVKG